MLDLGTWMGMQVGDIVLSLVITAICAVVVVVTRRWTDRDWERRCPYITAYAKRSRYGR